MRLKFFLRFPAMILSGKLFPMRINVNIGNNAMRAKAIACRRKTNSPPNKPINEKKHWNTASIN
jgi:hypothetical protein